MFEVQEVHLSHTLTRDAPVNFVGIRADFGFDLCVSPIVGDDQHTIMEHPLDVSDGLHVINGVCLAATSGDGVVVANPHSVAGCGRDSHVE